MYPLLNNASGGYTLAEVLVPTVAELELWYAPVRALGQEAMQNMGFLNFPLAFAMRSVFGWEVGNPHSGNHSCRCAVVDGRHHSASVIMHDQAAEANS